MKYLIISTKRKELIYSITSLSQISEKRFTQLLPHGLSQQLGQTVFGLSDSLLMSNIIVVFRLKFINFKISC